MASIQDFRVRKGILVAENATITGNTTISQQLAVTNSASFSNTTAHTGAATFANTVGVTGATTLSSTLAVSGNAVFKTSSAVIDTVNNRLSVNAASATVALYVVGDANVSGTFTTTTINATTINATTVAANVFSVVGGTNTSIDSSTLYVDAINNRVGINTVTPDAALQVSGSANVSTNIYAGGALTVGGAASVGTTLSVGTTSSHTGAATFSNTISVTGAATLSNTLGVTGAATFSNTMSVTGTATFTATISGSVNGNSNTCSRSISAGSYLTGGGALSADRTLNVDADSAATASKVVARDASGNFSANTITATLSGTATNASNLLYSGANRSATEAASNNSIMARDSNGDTYARYFRGTATSAQYADLAEYYIADAEYPVGTVIAVGGDKEVTAASFVDGARPIGVVSANPAFIMNEGLANNGGTAIALKGRVPVRVIGQIKKGQALGSSASKGVAQYASPVQVNFAVALEDKTGYDEGIIEAVIL